MKEDRLGLDEFVARLLEMGFVEDKMTHGTPALRALMKANPYIRSFDSPPSLRSAFRWLATGGSSLADFSVTVQDEMPDGSSREWGEHQAGDGSVSFGSMEPNEELLGALALGAEGFRKWFDDRLAYLFEVKRDGETVNQGVVTVGGETHAGGETVN